MGSEWTKMKIRSFGELIMWLGVLGLPITAVTLSASADGVSDDDDDAEGGSGGEVEGSDESGSDDGGDGGTMAAEYSVDEDEEEEDIDDYEDDDEQLECPNSVSAKPFSRAERVQCTVVQGATVSISGCPGVGITNDGTLTGFFPMSDCTAQVLATLDGTTYSSIIDFRFQEVEGFRGAAIVDDPVMGRAMEFSGSIHFGHTGGPSFEIPGGFTNTGLTWDEADQLFIASDFDTGSLLYMSSDGAPQGRVQTELGPGTLQGVSAGPGQKLFVADHFGESVYRILPTGWVSGEQKLTDLGYRPNGVDYDQGRHAVWIAEAGSNRVHRYSFELGELEETFEIPYIWYVDGLDYDDVADELWVTFDGNSVLVPGSTGIARVDAATGQLLDAVRDPVSAPEGIVVKRDEPGNATLWINDDGYFHGGTERGNRLHHWRTDGTEAPFNPFPELPFTIELSFNSPSQSGLGTLAWYGANWSSYRSYVIYTRPDLGNRVQAWHRNGSSNIATTTGGYVDGEWNHVVAVFTEDERHIYLNGGNHGVSTGYRAPVPVNRGSIGYSRDRTPGQPLQGRIAGMVVREGALSADEVAALYDDWAGGQ